jgi:hypothetical protein
MSCNHALLPVIEWHFFLKIRSFGFSGECLGQHSGAPQAANLGDGNGSCQ